MIDHRSITQNFQYFEMLQTPCLCISHAQTIVQPYPIHTTVLRASSKPVALWTRASRLIVLETINIWTVVECPIAFPHWSTTPLIQIVPVEACKWTMVGTSTLKKIRALLCTKLLQISGEKYNTIKLIIIMIINIKATWLDLNTQATLQWCSPRGQILWPWHWPRSKL